MKNIRPALPVDASRIAEIIIFNYRTNFYHFFQNDVYYYKELNVLDMASEYSENAESLKNTYVFDDGVVKGILQLNGKEIERLFVEPNFQNQGIGAELLKFAVEVKKAAFLWVLEYNKRAIAFYERNDFELTGEKKIEDEFVPLLKMSVQRKIRLRKILPDSLDISKIDRINHASFPDAQITEISDLFLSDKGDLDIIGIYLNNLLVGFFSVRSYKNIRYIGYLAIDPEYRNQGIGSKALKLLGKYYSGVQFVVEIETVETDSNCDTLRLYRRNFYLKNGFYATGWYLFYDETEFELLCSDTNFQKHEFEELTGHIHVLYYDSIPEMYQK